MKCEDCDEPATIHSSIIVAGVQQELHLCHACAERRQLVKGDATLNLPMIVKQFVGNVGIVSNELVKAQCPDCGIKYMEFRKGGRLGCPYDYVVFREALLPLLQRVHRAVRHRGKRPASGRPMLEADNELRHLRHQLKLAIAAERFEQAAALRDLIDAKGNVNEPG